MIRVLFVDDDAAILEAVQDALIDRFEVLTARDGVEALAVLAARPVDVVILDLMMPVMDGEQFMQAAARDPKIPVILASAVPLLRQRSVALGAAGFLNKPYRLEELVAAIERHGQGGPGGGASEVGGTAVGASPGTGDRGDASSRRARRARPAQPVLVA